MSIQVVLDLGHVTFGNVSDWSTENLELEVEHHLSGGDDEEDDGKPATHHPSPLWSPSWGLF